MVCCYAGEDRVDKGLLRHESQAESHVLSGYQQEAKQAAVSQSRLLLCLKAQVEVILWLHEILGVDEGSKGIKAEIVRTAKG